MCRTVHLSDISDLSGTGNLSRTGDLNTNLVEQVTLDNGVAAHVALTSNFTEDSCGVFVCANFVVCSPSPL